MTAPVPDAVPLDWDRLYLLGWYGPDKTPYLSSWMGSGKTVEAIVVGFNERTGPPLWNAPVPPLCKVYKMPEHIVGLDARVAYATHLGGVYAFGWLMDEPVDRKPKK